MNSDYLTTKQIAEILGVTPATVVHWIDLGHFPHAKKLNPHLRNSPLRVPRADVESFQAWQRNTKVA